VDDDRRAVRGGLFCSLPVEILIEDGADGWVVERIDVYCARGSGFEPFTAEGADKAQDAEARPETLFGMRLVLQDELTKRGRGGTDAGGFLADTIDRPVGVAPMTRWHVLAEGGVGVVTAPSHMAGDPLAPDEDLYGTRGEPHLNFAASEAVGNAVEVMLGLDVIIDADAAEAPLGEHVISRPSILAKSCRRTAFWC
jgi:hypothetical protein